MATYTRLLTCPNNTFFLFGMRGTGKTSWAREHLSGACWFNLLDESLYQRFLLDAGLFAAELRRLQAGSWVVVDEIQRLPGLLNEVHNAIEERGLRFALLGSSARKLRRAGVNLLGGRAYSRHLHPLLPAELGNDFNREQQLNFGSLPLVLNAESQPERLEAYVQTYLKEEIQAEAIVRNLPGFARFLPIAALFHGQVLNISALARDAGVHRSTVEGYLSILEDTLLAYRLPAFEGRLRVKERSHPKLYWIDSGVMRAAKRQLAMAGPEESGALFEGFVGLLLKAYRELNLIEYDQLFYWAAADAKAEVDFLINRSGSFAAVEVKSSARLSSAHFAGLRAIAALKGLTRRILVYSGERDFTTEDGIEVLSLPSFISQLTGGKI